MRELARRYGMHRTSLSRHKAAHLAPALVATVREREQAGPRSVLDRIEQLLERVERVLDRAEADGQAKLLLDASRELRGLLELLAKITGELRDAPQVAVVLTQEPAWQAFTARLVAVLDDYPPELGQQVLGALEAASGGDRT